VEVEDGVPVAVQGNTCPRGDAYGRSEVVDPRRTVTTSIPVTGSPHARMLSVKTASPVPKDRVADVMRAAARLQAVAPLAIGDVVLSNVAGTGVDLVATSAARSS
jgi:CxxC motif-containing protein